MRQRLNLQTFNLACAAANVPKGPVEMAPVAHKTLKVKTSPEYRAVPQSFRPTGKLKEIHSLLIPPNPWREHSRPSCASPANPAG